jgi:hypothetical protein
MRRILASLKYVPAVVCGLLVVAWVVSVPYSCGAKFGLAGYKGQLWTGLDFGDLMFHFSANIDEPIQWGSVRRSSGQLYSRPWFGQLKLKNYSPGENRLVLPIPLVLTALLPVCVAPVIHFRFPLWSYFAYTALVAAELAYYLR